MNPKQPKSPGNTQMSGHIQYTSVKRQVWLELAYFAGLAFLIAFAIGFYIGLQTPYTILKTDYNNCVAYANECHAFVVDRLAWVENKAVLDRYDELASHLNFTVNLT